MRILILILFLIITSPSWAYLTAGKVSVVKTSSSAGVPSTSQDSDISDTVGTSVSVGVPVAVTGNMNITGTYQVNGTPISATSNWNQNGSTINYTSGNVSIGSTAPLGLLTVIGGNVGIGSNVPGQALDVVGTVRATSFTGQSGHGLFGTWNSSNTYGTAYLAATDLIASGESCSTNAGTISGITDSNSSPSTTRASSSSGSSSGSNSCSAVTFPVRKGDYWEITATNGQGSVQYLPLGS